MILINTTNLYVGGGMQVGVSVINEMTELDILFTAAVSPPVYAQLNQSAKLKSVIFDKTPSGLMNFSTRKSLDKLVADKNISVVFTVFGPSYWTPKVNKHIVGFALPWLIYDTKKIYSSLGFKDKIKKLLLRMIQPYYFKKNADIIITETEDATNKVRELLNFKSQHVKTVSNTISDVFYHKELYDESVLLKLPKKKKNDVWLLTITHNYPHKNMASMKELVKILPDNFKFITTLGHAFNDDLPEIYRHRIVNIGPVNIYQCPPLYSIADALFLPTLLECFSASYAEALFMKKIILTSDRTFAKTICQESAYYFDPLNNNDIANTIMLAFNDDCERTHRCNLGVEIFSNIPNARSRAQQYVSILNGSN